LILELVDLAEVELRRPSQSLKAGARMTGVTGGQGGDKSVVDLGPAKVATGAA
jgi:hypothetical protein